MWLRGKWAKLTSALRNCSRSCSSQPCCSAGMPLKQTKSQQLLPQFLDTAQLLLVPLPPQLLLLLKMAVLTTQHGADLATLPALHSHLDDNADAFQELQHKRG